MYVHSYLQLQFGYKDVRIFLSSANWKSLLQQILIQWPIGHSGDDVNHKKPHKTKCVDQISWKFWYWFILKFSIELDTKR